MIDITNFSLFSLCFLKFVFYLKTYNIQGISEQTTGGRRSLKESTFKEPVSSDAFLYGLFYEVGNQSRGNIASIHPLILFL